MLTFDDINLSLFLSLCEYCEANSLNLLLSRLLNPDPEIA